MFTTDKVFSSLEQALAPKGGDTQLVGIDLPDGRSAFVANSLDSVSLCATQMMLRIWRQSPQFPEADSNWTHADFERFIRNIEESIEQIPPSPDKEVALTIAQINEIAIQELHRMSLDTKK